MGVEKMREKLNEFLVLERAGMEKTSICSRIASDQLDDLRTEVFNKLAIVCNNSQLIDFAVHYLMDDIKKMDKAPSGMRIYNFINRRPPSNRLKMKSDVPFGD
jgi:hypothetical protein